MVMMSEFSFRPFHSSYLCFFARFTSGSKGFESFDMLVSWCFFSQVCESLEMFRVWLAEGKGLPSCLKRAF